MKAKASIIILTILIFVACAVHGIAEEYDWPRWRGPNGDGISMETEWNPEALSGGPNILWKVDVGMGFPNVAIKNNRLYTIGSKGVVCLNAESGAEVWRFSDIRFSNPQSTPTIDGKYVYGIKSSGLLFCLKAKNGELRWKRDLVREYKT
jgi:outer membrane protein assembly factor BamB